MPAYLVTVEEHTATTTTCTVRIEADDAEAAYQAADRYATIDTLLGHFPCERDSPDNDACTESDQLMVLKVIPAPEQDDPNQIPLFAQTELTVISGGHPYAS